MKKTHLMHPTFVLDSPGSSNDRWNSKWKALTDTLHHHIKDGGEAEKPGSKGVYIDFKKLK